MRIVRQEREAGAGWEAPQDYLDLHVSRKVVHLIASYTAIVNHVTWGKQS
jgi:hypothetical protein